MYDPTIARVIVAKSDDSKCPAVKSAADVAKVISATASFLLLNFSLEVVKVIIHDE